jgi:hypothetical protein
VITKDLYTYTIIILRQDKSLRDHGRAAVCRVIGVHRDKEDTCPLAGGPGPAVASVESALRHRPLTCDYLFLSLVSGGISAGLGSSGGRGGSSPVSDIDGLARAGYAAGANWQLPFGERRKA